jgi:hypothetical protein
MRDPSMLIAAIFGLAVLYVLLPVSLHTFVRYRKKRVLSCPETGREAEVAVDAPRAALGSVMGEGWLLTVRACSLWPGRRECGQGCLQALGGGDPAEQGRQGP